MQRDSWFRVVMVAGVLSTGGCTGNEAGDGPENFDDERSTLLNGRLLDADGNPVPGAEVSLAVGSVPVGGDAQTDEQGFYSLYAPTDEIQAAWDAGQEVTVLFHSPTTDQAPFGTAEGDYVELLPVTLSQFVESEAMTPGAMVAVTTAYVPRQGRGFAIDDRLLAEGGVLTWRPKGTQYGDDFSVSLIIEPGSIHLGDDAQEEITLTLLEQTEAPMRIPEDGFGPLWTIQPRNVSFDPPAKIRIEGDRMPVLGISDLEVGEVTDLFGASLETGWKLFGDIMLTAEDGGRITLETPIGVISHGAWGHVFGPSGSDWGMLVECFDKADPTKRVRCALLDDNGQSCEEGPAEDHTGFLKCAQIDYNGAHHKVYSTSMEPRCRTCGADIAPYVLATGVDDTGSAQYEDVRVIVRAVALCPDEYEQDDMAALHERILDRYGFAGVSGGVPYDFEQFASEEAQATLSWRNFSKKVHIKLSAPTNCP